MSMAGKEFKTGIIVPVYDRWEYFRRTLISLNASIIPAGCYFYFVSDAIVDDPTDRLFHYFNFKHPVKRIYHSKNSGVSLSLRTGYEAAIKDNCNILVNVDSDVIVKKDWLEKLFSLHGLFPNAVITGFNSNSRDHKIIKKGDGFLIKSSAGGVNFLISDKIYNRYFYKKLVNFKGWDWAVSRELSSNKIPIIVTTPSVVQHIGVHSSLNHYVCDVAEDF